MSNHLMHVLAAPDSQQCCQTLWPSPLSTNNPQQYLFDSLAPAIPGPWSCYLPIGLLQDPYGRTPLHTAITCRALRTADALLHKQPELAHSVDVFGNSPLDNAIIQNYEVGIALIKRVGGLSGSDPKMAKVAQTTLAWQRTQREQREAKVLAHAMHQLPEYVLLEDLSAVEAALHNFVEVGLYFFMITMWLLKGCVLTSYFRHLLHVSMPDLPDDMHFNCCLAGCILSAATVLDKSAKLSRFQFFDA